MRNDMNGFRIDGDASRTIADQSCLESNPCGCGDHQRGAIRDNTRETGDHNGRCERCGENGGRCSACETGNSRGGFVIRDCDCDEGRSMAMVYAQDQHMGSVFDLQDAIVRGTLFPCLYKPMCQDDGCERNRCVRECQKMNFAAWEVRLYLNTHPNDKKALALLRRLRENECCENGYATVFLEDTCNRWSWIDDPWPWEYQCCKEEE